MITVSKLLNRILILAGVITVSIAAFSSKVYANVPYDTYAYNYYGEAVAQPHVYLFDRTIDFDGFSIKNPQDMFVSGNEIFIADTDNSRIIKTNDKGEELLIISFGKGAEDPLSKPQGVFVAADKHIFVADSGNGRIVEFDETGAFVKEIGRPETDLIDESFIYTPQKVVVDKDGRIYVTAYGINMGLLEFNSEGEFQSFMGAAKVSVSFFEYIWKNYFSTKEQKARMATIVPTEYSNLFVDQENFIYATINNLSSSDMLNGADAIRRLNPTGDDILRRLGHYDIIGDIYRSQDGAWSSFVDVTATDYGCYFVLDQANGKVFGYDYDGNSLFAFGRNGNREGNVQNAVAIGISDNADKIYILDYQLAGILVFDITEYGDHLLSALRLTNIGDSDGAIREWRQVLRLNGNNEFAYSGLGKNYLAEGDYKTALEYFKNGNNKKYYSKALYYRRKEIMEKNFGKVMLFVAILALLPAIITIIRRIRKWAGEARCAMEEN